MPGDPRDADVLPNEPKEGHMRVKLLIIAALAFGLTAGGALAKGGPPAGHESNGKSGEQHGNSGAGTTDQGTDTSGPEKTPPPTAQANKAAVAAKKEAAFQKQTKTLGYTCKPGTTHVEGTVVSVVPATATTAGTMTILVTKGNSRGKTLVGQTITVALLTSTDVIKTGHTTQAALAVGAKVKLDLRLCTDDAVGSVPGLVARKVFSNK
jgi:hypothetical protein